MHILVYLLEPGGSSTGVVKTSAMTHQLRTDFSTRHVSAWRLAAITTVKPCGRGLWAERNKDTGWGGGELALCDILHYFSSFSGKRQCCAADSLNLIP